ncbi:MAG: LamG domain-containing protein [Candidatus Woesearchaeota archaeon]|nr:MAG: LamG domain-containing protein [Candidatus Woesearchaeota archaeon]
MRKGIGAVFSVLLLLIVTLLASIAFYIWHGSFSSGVFAQISSAQGESVEILGLVGDSLYLRASGSNVSVNRINIGEKTCSFSSLSLNQSIQVVSLSSCLEDEEKKVVRISVFSDGGIEEKSFYYSSKPSSNSLCDNLTLLYHFDNEGGAGENASLVYDWSNSGFNATCSGASCPTLAAGKFGSSYEFDGFSTYFTLGTNTLIQGSDNVSLCFWLYSNSASLSSDGAVIARYSGGSVGWVFWIDDESAYLLTTDTMSFSPAPGGGEGGRSEGSSSLISYHTWDFYCGTFEANDAVRLYKNGVLINESFTTETQVGSSVSDPITLGVIASGDRYFEGRLDEMVVWKRELTPTEIAQLYVSSRLTC